jgi:hypothetical protein
MVASYCGFPCTHKCIADALVEHISRTGDLPLLVNDCAGSRSKWYEAYQLHTESLIQTTYATTTSVKPSVRMFLSLILTKIIYITDRQMCALLIWTSYTRLSAKYHSTPPIFLPWHL